MRVQHLALIALTSACAHGPTAMQARNEASQADSVQPTPSRTVTDPVPPPQAEPDAFAATVRPILVRRCSPCHFSGGVMYGRLPFDTPEGVVAAGERDGFWRRLKSDGDPIRAWLATRQRQSQGSAGTK